MSSISKYTGIARNGDILRTPIRTKTIDNHDEFTKKFDTFPTRKKINGGKMKKSDW